MHSPYNHTAKQGARDDWFGTLSHFRFPGLTVEVAAPPAHIQDFLDAAFCDLDGVTYENAIYLAVRCKLGAFGITVFPMCGMIDLTPAGLHARDLGEEFVTAPNAMGGGGYDANVVAVQVHGEKVLLRLYQALVEKMLDRGGLPKGVV